MQIYSKKIIKQGETIMTEDDKKTYKVLACIDLNWLYRGEQDGYLLQLREVEIIKED